MKKQTVEDLQKVLWGLSDIVRGDLEPSEGALTVTALWTLKVLLDNKQYYRAGEDLDWQMISAHGGDLPRRIQFVTDSIERQEPQFGHMFSGMGLHEHVKHIEIANLHRLIQELDKEDLRFEAMENPDLLNGTLALTADLWFEHILNKGGIRGNEISTPRQITELCARLLKVTHGTVYDGTMGIGGMLIAAAREARRNGAPVPELFGQELDSNALAIAKMNLTLHGLHASHLALGDTLTDPRWVEDPYRLKRFDYILMNPPFALKPRDKTQFETDPFGRYRYGVPSAAFADMAFVQHVVASLTDTGKAVLVQPHGVLLRGGVDQSIRQGLLENDLIEAVIFLPRNLLFNTGIPVALLVLNKQNPHPGFVQFVKADEEYQKHRFRNVLRPEDIEKICDVYHHAREVDGYSRLVKIEEISRNDWSLNITRYIESTVVDSKIGPVHVSIRAYRQSPIPKIRLGDIAYVERGFGSSKEIDGDDELATHRLINLSDVDENGNIRLETTTPIALDRKVKMHELSPGDLILSSRGTTFKVAVIPETKERLVASANFIVIRLKKGFQPYFVKSFLESPVGMQLLETRQRGSAVPVLSHKDIMDVQIPDLSLELQDQIARASITAEQEYQEAIQVAQHRYREQYHKIYELMGLSEVLNVTGEVKKDDG